MCRILLSQVNKRSRSTSTLLDDNLCEAKRLRRIFTELCRRCESPESGLDLLEFLKFTGLQGLLGEQFFRALDADGNGRLNAAEFASGLLRLYRGSKAEVAELLFVILDFAQKGFIVPADVWSVLTYLPSQCLRCGSHCSANWNFTERVETCFAGKDVLRFDDVLLLTETHELFSVILEALITSLPLAVDEAVESNRNACGQEVCREVKLQTLLKPLKFEGRRYFFEIRNGTMYCFNSVDQTTPKRIIPLHGLFISSVGDAAFILSALRTEYEFLADTPSDRDEWIALLLKETHFRRFEDFFEPKETLGAGSYGEVLRAVSRSTGDLVAVKVILKAAMDAAAELRLKRELTVLRHTSHPSLVAFLDCFETPDRIYIVTELLEGGTLLAYLEIKKFTVSEDFARKIAADVAAGLAYLHDHGIVHRDVKLDNIMLRREGEGAVLVDFGLACFLGPGDETSEAVGTLKYVAPEVVSRLMYSEKADCWSFGVVLYILLRGKMPFFGKTEQDVAQSILTRRLSFKKWASADAAELLSGLLCREAQDRLCMLEVLQSEWLQDSVHLLDSSHMSILC